MAVSCFDELRAHVGHRIECVLYGAADDPHNVAVECRDCETVLSDYDAPGDAEPQPNDGEPVRVPDGVVYELLSQVATAAFELAGAEPGRRVAFPGGFIQRDDEGGFRFAADAQAQGNWRGGVGGAAAECWQWSRAS